jgi:phospholipid-translocating ATPase
MNIYFLIIACLQLWSVISPVDPASTWVPLAIIFAISAIKEAVDDIKRYLNDKQANQRRYDVIRNGVKYSVFTMQLTPQGIF